MNLRQSAVYGCMAQLWRSIPGYSEGVRPRQPIESMRYDEGIVATTLALATRLYSQQVSS